MEINTNTLGPVEIDESRIINFVAPILGVEQGGKRYALLDLNPQSQVKLLQSVEDAHVCFLVGDPAAITPKYVVDLPDEARKELGLDNDAQAAVMVILTVLGDDSGATTANLKAPIIINRGTLAANQVILHNADYSTKAPVTVNKG